MSSRQHPDQGFAFISVSRPQEVKQKAVQKKIRHHVMSKVGKARRKRPRTFALTIEMPATDGTCPIKLQSVDSLCQKEECMKIPQPLFSYGSFAVTPTTRARQLIHFIHVEAEYLYRPFRSEWFSMAINDTSAYYLSLANAALFMNHMIRHGGVEYSDCPESLNYYSTCLTTVSQRLSSSIESISEGVVTTVLGFLCHDSNVGNWQRWAVHMEGLQNILKIRGGVHGLDSCVTSFIFWMDVIGSAVYDIAPRFPLPAKFGDTPVPRTPVLPYLQSLLFRINRKRSPELDDITTALERANHVTHFIHNNASNQLFWRNGINGARSVGPLSHYLLSLPRLNYQNHSEISPEAHLRELTRLTLLIILAKLKLAFKLVGDELELLKKRFVQLLLQVDMPLMFPELSLWAFSTVGSTFTGTVRRLLIDRTHLMTQTMEIRSAKFALEAVRGVILLEAIMGEGVDTFLRECFDSQEGRCSPSDPGNPRLLYQRCPS